MTRNIRSAGTWVRMDPPDAPTGPVEPTNLWVGNHGFATNLTGWTANPGTAVRQATGGPQSVAVPGGPYARISVPANGTMNHTADIQTLTLVSGETLSTAKPRALKVWVRASAPTRLTLSADHYDNASDRVYKANTSAQFTATSVWSLVSVPLLFAPGVGAAQINVNAGAGPHSARTIDTALWRLEATS